MLRDRVPILANAGTAVGLLLAEAKREDIMAHPEFQAAVASIRRELVKSLTAAELQEHTQFQAVVAQAVEAGVTAKIAGLTPEQIIAQEPFKTVLDTKVRETLATSENAKAFVAMLKDVAGSPLGHQAGEPNAQHQQAEPKPIGSYHEDSLTLDQATKAIMAADKTVSYGEAMITASRQIQYRKEGVA